MAEKKLTEVIKKTNNILTFDDIVKASALIAGDVSVYLSEEIDELNINSYKFKRSLEVCIVTMLTHLSKRLTSVAIFSETIPGFTVMSFLKDKEEVIDSGVENGKINYSRSRKGTDTKNNLISAVIGKHFEKNDKKVIYIENKDVVLIFFPLKDTRKNLKELGFYVTT